MGRESRSAARADREVGGELQSRQFRRVAAQRLCTTDPSRSLHNRLVRSARSRLDSRVGREGEFDYRIRVDLILFDPIYIYHGHHKFISLILSFFVIHLIIIQSEVLFRPGGFRLEYYTSVKF